MNQRKAWTLGEDTYLREHYKTLTYEEMAAALGRSHFAVQNRCLRLELFTKRWAPWETEYIQAAWGHTSIYAMAKKLGRSTIAVKQKADKLGLGRFLDSGELVTFLQVVQAITGGIGSYTWLREKWSKHGFPFRHQKVITKTVLMVKMGDFWKWAEQHQSILNFSKFEEHSLGGEPEWAKRKRRQDYRNQSRNARPWTITDEQRLKDLLAAQRYSLDEIAERLFRSESAIYRRIGILGIKDWPVRNPGKRWSQEEIDLLLKMHGEGKTFEEIGAKIGRSASACRGRYRRTPIQSYDAEGD